MYRVETSKMANYQITLRTYRSFCWRCSYSCRMAMGPIGQNGYKNGNGKYRSLHLCFVSTKCTKKKWLAYSKNLGKLKKTHISKKTHWVRSTKCEKGLRPFLNQSVKIGLLIGPLTVVFGLSMPPFQVVRKGPTIFTNLNWKIGQHFCPPLWKLLSIHCWMPAITDNMPPWHCMVSGRI